MEDTLPDVVNMAANAEQAEQPEQMDTAVTAD
jgi:hypothetical protein